jgi:hypothetical protein
MAKEPHVFLIHNGKPAWDVFHIGDAVGVETFYDDFDLVGDFHLLFVHDFKVLDLDKGSRGGHQGDLVDFVPLKICVANFDEAFFAVLLAIEVIAEQHLVFVVFQVQYVQHFKYIVGGDMIDYGAVFDGRNIEVMLFFVHFTNDIFLVSYFLYLTPAMAASNAWRT